MGSNSVGVNERRSLKKHAELLEQIAQLYIEKRHREVILEETKKQIDMKQRLLDLQAEADNEEMKSRKGLSSNKCDCKKDAGHFVLRPSLVYLTPD